MYPIETLATNLRAYYFLLSNDICLKVLRILLKVLLQLCKENTAQEAGQEINIYIQHVAKLSTVFISRHTPECCVFTHTGSSGALSGISIVFQAAT